MKREKALAVFEIGDRVQIREILPIGLGPIHIEGEIVTIRLTNERPRKLVLELSTGHAIELSSWNLFDRKTEK